VKARRKSRGKNIIKFMRDFGLTKHVKQLETMQLRCGGEGVLYTDMGAQLWHNYPRLGLGQN